eukprot:GILJ01003053.1.p1 GENE.GILJ01003053.1~~GILJ01003053.1.p1  ORF type:complete len:445 (+),score=56.59 GILJ01003053.1:1072-2406(+)
MDNDGDDEFEFDPKVLHARLVVEEIKLEGNERAVADYILGAFEDVKEGRTLQEIIQLTDLATQVLHEDDVFEKVDVALQPGSSSSSVIMKVSVEEKSMFTGGVFPITVDGEDVLEVQAGIRNVFGRAESLALSAGWPYPQRLTFIKPHPIGLDLNITSSLFHRRDNFDTTSSFTQSIKGATAAIELYNGHSLGFYVGNRSLTINDKTASDRMFAEVRESMKASIKYTFIDDQIDDHFAPSEGRYRRLTTEYAGLFGHAHFLKTEFKQHNHFPLSERLVLSLGVQSGLVQPLSMDRFAPVPVRISDRFFLGGPFSLRGFNKRGAGPCDLREPSDPAAGRDFVGGNAYLTMSTQISYIPQIEAFESTGTRLFAFGNAGNLFDLPRGNVDPVSGVKHVLSTSRASVGVGISVPLFGIARADLLYAWILRRAATDDIQQLQFGFTFGV